MLQHFKRGRPFIVYTCGLIAWMSAIIAFTLLITPCALALAVTSIEFSTVILSIADCNFKPMQESAEADEMAESASAVRSLAKAAWILYMPAGAATFTKPKLVLSDATELSSALKKTKMLVHSSNKEALAAGC